MGNVHGKRMKVKIPPPKPKVMNKKNTKTSITDAQKRRQLTKSKTTITDAQKRTQTKKMSAKEKKARASLLKLGYKNPTKAMIDKYSIVFDYDKAFKLDTAKKTLKKATGDFIKSFMLPKKSKDNKRPSDKTTVSDAQKQGQTKYKFAKARQWKK